MAQILFYSYVENIAEAERFAAEDPYVLAELVTERRIEPIALV